MKAFINNSDSVINSLCREIEYIKSRSKSIKYSLNNCQNSSLIIRLKNELLHLKKRMSTIEEVTFSIRKINRQKSLSLDFLCELIGRSLINI